MAIQVTAAMWRDGEPHLACESIRIYQAPDRTGRVRTPMDEDKLLRLRRAWAKNATPDELADD